MPLDVRREPGGRGRARATRPAACIGLVDLDRVLVGAGWKAEFDRDRAAAANESARVASLFTESVKTAMRRELALIAAADRLSPEQTRSLEELKPTENPEDAVDG